MTLVVLGVVGRVARHLARALPARPQARARVLQRRERRHHPDRPRPRLLGARAGATARLAALGFGGGLLHVWNHAVMKGLMFLGAGSVLHGAGTKDLERLGGLLKRMPRTGPAMMLGAVAIAGLAAAQRLRRASGSSTWG